MKDNIIKCMQDFSNITFFPANWLKCNIATYQKLNPLIENGFIEGTELRVILDLNVDEGKIRIGMGAGPTYSETEI